MELTDEQRKFIEFPPLDQSISKVEVLRILRTRQALEREAALNARQEHEDAMTEWRATIADRLMAIIPKLEDGSFNSSMSPSYGGDIEPLKPPRWWDYMGEEKTIWQARIDIVEAICLDEFSPELRKAMYEVGVTG